MMKKIILTLTIVCLTAAVGFSQQPKPNRKTDPNAVDKPEPYPEKKESTPVDTADATDDSLLKIGSVLSGELQSTLDVKKSKVGDQVILKTTKSIKENGEVVIPKGTKMIGRITEIQQKTKQNATSKIGLVFETIQGKNLSTPFGASIVSITSATNNLSAGDLFGSSSSANSNSSGTVSGGSSGGGLLGGGLVGGATQTVGGVVNSTSQTVGGLTDVAGQTVGGVSNSTGSLTRGLQINQSASANSSSTISAEGKNVKIEKGASFNLMLTKSIEN